MTGRQKEYLRNQMIILLAALGIAEGEEVSRKVAMSEWGTSMRSRQKR
jgi:hypothetical protein